MQSRTGSLIEALAGTAIGFVVAMLVNYGVMHMWGFSTFNWGHSFAYTLIFTAISIVRVYLVRRLFNRIHGRDA